MNRFSHRQVRRNRARSLLVLFLLLSASFASLVSPAASAQPLCLDGTIWDADAEECVSVDEDQPPADDSTGNDEGQPTADDSTEDDEDQQPIDDGDDAESSEGTAESEDGEEEDTTLRADEGTGEIKAYVFDCPAGLDIQVTEPDLMHTSCVPHLENIQFDLDLDGQISSSSTNTLGRTTYTSVPPGQYRLRIILPEGSDSPVVFCTVTGPSGQTLENYDRFDVSNTGSIGLGMDAMEFAACDFFLSGEGLGTAIDDEIEGFPPPTKPPVNKDDIVGIEDVEGIELTDDTPGEVTLVNHVCPVGFDAYAASARDINIYCEYDKEAIFEFNLTDGAGGYQIQHTELNYPLAEFESVAPGAISVMESIPPGFGEPVVYCQSIPDEGEPTAYTQQPVIQSNTIEFTLQPSTWFACDWFNVPVAGEGESNPVDTVPDTLPDKVIDEGMSNPEPLPTVAGLEYAYAEPGKIAVNIMTHYCTRPVASAPTTEELWAACPYDDPAKDPVTYSIAINGQFVAFETAEESEPYPAYAVYWDDVEPGDLTIAASTPFPYQAPHVRCGTWDDDNVQSRSLAQGNIQSGTVTIPDVPADTITRCSFFFPPDQASIPLSVTVSNCPQQVLDEQIINYDDLQLACGDPTEAVEVQIITSSGVQSELSDPGYADFDGVTPGDIQIREIIPQGYGLPYVYCQVTGPNGTTIKQRDLEIIGQNYYIKLDDIAYDSLVWCDFFNLPGETPDQTDDVPRSQIPELGAIGSARMPEISA